MEALKVMLANATSSITSGVDSACASACNKTTINAIFAGIANALIFVVGAVAVIMIIVGALRYATSNGDSKATASAKDTILYAVVALVVAIASYGIVTFVLKAVK